MDNQNTNLPKTGDDLMHEFMQKEKKELEVRQEETRNRRAIVEIEAETIRHKNQLDHDIAMRGIEAQLQDRVKQMDTARQMQENKRSIWVLIVILSFTVIVTAFLFGMGKEVMELVKYAITAIIGYFAGMAKGKFEKIPAKNWNRLKNRIHCPPRAGFLYPPFDPLIPAPAGFFMSRQEMT